MATQQTDPRDQEKRLIVRDVLDENIMVLAGAGAGKTHELVTRMTNLVASGAIEVERIAAITFTRKAAGEMRGRFMLAMRKRARDADGDERRRLEDGIRSIDRCFVGTIHAFCGRLLRERPVEAGLSPDFEEVEGPAEADLAREAWDTFIDDVYVNAPERIDHLETLGLTTEDLYDFFLCRYGSTDLPLKLATDDCPDLSPEVEKVREFLSTCLDNLPPDRDRHDAAMTRLEDVRHFLTMRAQLDVATSARLLGMLERAPAVVLKCWKANRAFAKELRDTTWPGFVQDVIEPALTRWRRWVYRHAAEFVDEAVEHFRTKRLRDGTLIFHDLLMVASELLRDDADVRRYFQSRFGCILVDEFQDTDPVQAELLFYLTGSDVNERNWRRLRPRPGSLFVVGDAKQSIYRFRRADVDTFDFVRRRIVETGGREVHLDTSFRSLGNLCDWLNESFEPLFEATNPPYQASFARMLRYRPGGQDTTCVRRIVVPKVHGNNRRIIAEMEADDIARFIEAAVDGRTKHNGDKSKGALLPHEASPGDFMIISRTKKQLSIYARALEARRIPYDLVGGDPIGSSAEVRALVNLMQCVLVPDNPVPYLTHLRGLFGGLSDVDLYRYRRAGGSFDARDDLPELDDHLARQVGEARQFVRRMDALLHRLGPAAAMERVLVESGLTAFASTGEMGGTRAGNLYKLTALVRSLENDGKNWAEIAEELIRIINEPTHAVDSMTLETGRSDVVRIMNLHQSKGLQASVVFLVDSYDARKNHTPTQHVARSGDQPYLSTVIDRSNGFNTVRLAEPPDWPADEAEEARYLEAEELRLVYVAATRAQDMLVVCTYDDDLDGKGPWGVLRNAVQHATTLEIPGSPSEMASDGIAQLPTAPALRGQWPVSAQPSYAVERVTSTDETHVEELPVEGGRGKVYGTIVHDLLEASVLGLLPDDLRPYVDAVCRSSDLLDATDDILRAVRSFEASSVWKEMRLSDTVLTEVPFTDVANGTIRRGVIDLVYRNPSGWRIVDYKTDRGDPSKLSRRYGPQVRSYVSAWRRTTGEEAVECGLWLTATGELVPIDV